MPIFVVQKNNPKKIFCEHLDSGKLKGPLFFQAVFRTKLSFRPHSTESFTHQKMTRSMADRTNKATGIKVISQVGRDPEANRCVFNSIQVRLAKVRLGKIRIAKLRLSSWLTKPTRSRASRSSLESDATQKPTGVYLTVFE